jgi:glycosyltransferase involved in cell wall biosynthesis
MKKIAVISNTFPPFSGGGVATAQYNLFKKLLEAGYEVRGYTFYDHGKIKVKEENIIRCGVPKLVFRTITMLTKAYFSRKQKKDCATSHEYAWQWNFTLNSAIGCRIINRKLQKFQPDIIILPDLGTPNYYIKKPNKDCKMVMISHHNAMRFINNPLIDKHSELDAKLVNDLENKGMANVDEVICPSEYMKEVFINTHKGFNGRIEVVPNIINEDLIEKAPKIDIKEELGMPQNAPLIYIPAANTPVKGPRYVFEIIRRLTEAYAKPIGFYLSAGLTEELAFELKYKPENAIIYVPGYVEYARNIGIIKGCDFGITPTLLESFGMAILEANMCGVPMVSFNTGGNADIINNDKDGFLVDYLDMEALIKKSLLLLSNAQLRQEMGEKARENALNNYNSGRTLESLISKIF